MLVNFKLGLGVERSDCPPL